MRQNLIPDLQRKVCLIHTSSHKPSNQEKIQETLMRDISSSKFDEIRLEVNPLEVNVAQYFSSHRTKSAKDNLVWIDCEMTGLDPNKDHILEIAVIVTDKDLNVLAEGPNLVIHQSNEVLSSMGEWCVQHHGESGLTEKVKNSKLSLKDCENQVLEFVQEWTPKGKCPLAGNSIGQDAKFLEKYMPNLMNHLHYRIVDVTSVKELVKRWYPGAYYGKPSKKLAHRALDDILESIDELKYYRQWVFKDPKSKEQKE